MATNLFAKPLYEDQEAPPKPIQVTAEDRVDPTLEGLTDEQIVAAKTPVGANLFAKPMYEEEPPVAAPPPQEPSMLARVGAAAKDYGYAAAQGLGGAFNKLERTLGLAGGAVADTVNKMLSAGSMPVPGAAGVLAPLFSGMDDKVMQDKWFKTFVDPTVEAESDFQLGPDASFGQKASHATGAMLGLISQVVLTGGEGAAPAAATGADVGVKGAMQFAGETAAHGAKAMAVPAVADAVDTGRKVLQETGDGTQAVKAAQAQYLTTTLNGIVPLSAPGNVATRVAGGAVSGAVTGEMSRELMNTVLPEQLQQATTKADVALDALMGGLAGGVMGPRAQRAPAERGPLSAIEEAGNQASEESAAGGGDMLDQALSAARAHADLSSQHAEAFYEHSGQMERLRMADEAAAEQRTRAEEEAQQQAAQQQAILDEQTRQEAGTDDYRPVERPRTGEEEPPPTEKGLAFKRAEAAKEAAKQTTTEEAYRQRGEQEVERAMREPGAEPARATLADVAPPELLKPREPTTRNLFEKPIHEPEAPPKTLTERRAQEALPAPRTARFEVSKEGVARAVTEGEMEARAPFREGLAVRREAVQRERVLPIEKERIDRAAHEAATSPKNNLPEPTEAQKQAGNYQKGHVQIQGLDVSIENPKGSTRLYTNEAGERGQRTMQDHYGYVRGTEGADGDHVDAFIGEHPESDRVFVVDQLKQSGGFDEHKAMIGYRNQLDAVRAYRRNFQKGWKVGPVKEMSVGEFKQWLKDGDTTKPLQPEKIPQPATHEQVEQVRTLAERKRKDSKLVYREGDDTSENNASGESPASLEAIRRLRAERENKQDRYTIDPDGNVSPLRTVDSVDAKAQPGHVIVQRGIGADDFTVLDRGGLPVAHARGLLNRAKGLGAFERVEKPAEAPAGLQEVHPGFTRIPKGTKVQFSRGFSYKNVVGRVVGERVMRLEGGKLYAVPVVEAPDGRTIRLSPDNIEKVFRPRTLSREGAPVKDGTGITHEDAQKALEPLTREMPRLEPRLVRTHKDTPIEIRTQIEEAGQQDARGVYDPESDTLYIFSANHDSPEEVMRTALHEGVGHKGLRYLLRSKFESLMRDIHSQVANREWIDDFMAQHGLDPTNPEHQITAAEEYAASLAERQDFDPPLLRKAIDAIRAALRDLGLVRAWTDNDIRALLRKARTSLRDRSAHSFDRVGGLRYADKDYTKQAERLPDSHPLNVFLKQGATVEEQANYNPGFIRSRIDALKDFGENNIEALLGAIPRRNLPDFVAPGKMPSTAAYVREAARMDGRRNELLVKGDKIASRWTKFVRNDRASARTLGELMHAATLAGVEPANEYRPKYSNPETPEQRAIEQQRKRQWLSLNKFWNALPGEARALYVDVRDSYAADRDLIMKGLEARIEATDADGKTKQSLLAELRKKFEAGRVEGPYFPLGRYGKHWAVAKDAEGAVVSFTRFEKPSEQRQWMAEMEKAGYKVDGGVQMQDREMARRIDPNFVAKITDLLRGVDTELADEVWQSYLRAMPEMSMRKHFIHRKGRLGFTMDALRNFGYQKFHGAHQIAKLEHMHVLERHLEQMKVEAVKLARTPEEKWAAALSKEFDKRHEWMRNPKASGIATALTSLGFMYYLGATPAAAMVNLTQNAMVAFPTLASKHNWTGAGIEMFRAAAQFAGSRGSLANKLRGDERLAFDEGKRIGLFDKTMAHDLAQIGEEGMDYGSTRNRVMNLASWLFHQAEEFNRQTTFLAAYRLGRRKGMGHDAAIEHAEDVVWDSHFDYSNTNRARYLQSDAAKVLLLFRQYAANMTYRLTRDFNNSLRGATPEQRHEARVRFTGMLGQTMLFAGASGLPLWWAASGIINTLFSDEDTPFDAEAELRAWLAKQYGDTVSSTVLDGPVSALTQATVNTRVGLNNMWVQDAPTGMEGKELGLFYLGQAAGPLGGLAVRAFDAGAPSPEGFGERALEKVMPKALGDVLKAVRYAREGVTNQRGDVITPASQISNYDTFLQAVGFTPYKVSLQYEKNRNVSEYSQKIMARKALLKNKLNLMRINDDSRGVDETMEEIGKFNAKNPGVAIKAEDIISSAIARGKYGAEAVNGVHVEPGLRYLHDHFNSEVQE